METTRRIWLADKVTSLEKGMLKKDLQETGKTIAVQERTVKEISQRLSMVETAITLIVEHAQRQILFNESTRTSIAKLTQEVQRHGDHFQEVVRVLQSNEQCILKNDTVSVEMAQSINALIQDSQNKNAWIGSPMMENQEQSHVLRHRNTAWVSKSLPK